MNLRVFGQVFESATEPLCLLVCVPSERQRTSDVFQDERLALLSLLLFAVSDNILTF